MIELQYNVKTNNPLFEAENLLVLDRSLTFRNDEKFQSILTELAENNKEKSREWRVHIFLWAFKNGLRLEGDLIECGVYRGFSSAFAVRYTEFEKYNKRLLLFDTWDGIPEKQLDKGRKQISEYFDPHNYKKVTQRFEKYSNVEIIKGQVPEVFKRTEIPEKISFLHLDMNSSIAEIGALEVLFDKMEKGAICILDDYGLQIAKEQTRVESEWIKKKGLSICELPTGQGMFIKV